MEIDEKELVEAAKTGDSGAWTELVNRYGGKVYGIALRFLLNEKDAEDTAQDVWMLVSRKLKNFRGESRFGTWLYRVAVNRCLEKIRSRKRSRVQNIDDFLPRFNENGGFLEQVPDWSRQPAAEADLNQMKREIEDIIRQVPDKYREVLVLRDIEGLSGAEAGEMLGLTEAGIKTRLHRARAFVREKMAKKFGEKPWFAFLRVML